MRLPVKHALPLAVLIVLAGCGGDNAPLAPRPPANGPAADYPMVIGDPFTIGDTTYTPADKLNSDEVGYASIGEAGETGISGAHKTLPLPSYVEVTSLDSGRTILVRLERRGPMRNDYLIELSPGAAAQLGIAGAAKTPVRVRRVNPPEQERAMLRRGDEAPERMETPKGLLTALRRKLGIDAPPSAPISAPAPSPSSTPGPTQTPVPTPVPAAEPAATAKPAAGGGFIVQIAAFSTERRASDAASTLGAHVSHPGKFWLMRLGPFASRTEAEAALAKAKAAGYSDARIQRAD